MKTKLIIFMTFTIILTSCLSTSYMRLLNIRMGMSSEQIFNILESDEYNDYDVHLINGREDLFDISQQVQSNSSIKVLIANKYYPMQSGDDEPYYLFAFEDEKLIFWGLPLEFARKNDPKINKIAELAVEIINKDYMD